MLLPRKSACARLRDRLGHRSFAGLTTQTQVHHNKFDKRQHGIHALTQQHMHQGRYDKHCIFLTPFFFFFLFFCLCRNCNLNSIGVEPQRIIQSDESWDMIWARAVCGGMYSTSLHILYSHLRWREAHVRSEIWSWKGCQNGNIRASIHFPLWWKLRCESLVLVHYEAMGNVHSRQ